ALNLANHFELTRSTTTRLIGHFPFWMKFLRGSRRYWTFGWYTILWPYATRIILLGNMIFSMLLSRSHRELTTRLDLSTRFCYSRQGVFPSESNFTMICEMTFGGLTHS